MCRLVVPKPTWPPRVLGSVYGPLGSRRSRTIPGASACAENSSATGSTAPTCGCCRARASASTSSSMAWRPVRYMSFMTAVTARSPVLHLMPWTGRPFSGRGPKATIALLQGGDGSTVLDGGRVWRPTVRHPVQVVDPIGAGDAYVAGYLWATLGGRTPQEAVNVAATVAALKCSTWGDVALISPRDVADALAGGPDVRR